KRVTKEIFKLEPLIFHKLKQIQEKSLLGFLNLLLSSGQMRKNDLKRVTKEIFKLEPLIFHKLKQIQEKSLLGFLNLLLSSEERENVLTIIEQVVELSPQQRADFSMILKKTSLENIIDTIKFIEDRYKVIELLKSIDIK
ncbi:hypothetical protein DW070_17325, partial [Coprococcus catus]